MLQISYSRLIALMCFFLPVVLLSSCEKEDDDANNGQVQLLSFGPTGAKHGDTLRFFGQNLNKVTAIQFTGTGAVVEQKDFKSQSSDLVLLIVPSGAERGFVTLKTPEGDIITKTMFNLNVKTSASITTITKDARPGANITITGNYLNWVKQITFAQDKVVTTFVSQSLNQLVVKVPDDAQSGPLLLSFSGTDTIDIQTADTLWVALPVATALSPNPVKHAANLTITGTNLDLATKIMFTGVPTPVTTFVSQTATQIVVKVPGETTKGKITLEAASGMTTQSSTDLDVMLPAVSAMSPNPVDPLTNVTITGSNLDLVSSITFNNAPAVTSFVSQSATQIVVRVPAGVASGKITLSVLNSTLKVQSPAILDITGDAPPPVIALPFYKDAVTSNWNGWSGDGWGGTKDFNNTSPVREGSNSIKINYVNGYGSPLQLGGANVTIAPYTTFKISIYGAPGSAGKKIRLGINGADNYEIIIVEGKWTDYSIPLSTLTSAATLTEILVKEYSGVGGFSIYVDALGIN